MLCCCSLCVHTYTLRCTQGADKPPLKLLDLGGGGTTGTGIVLAGVDNVATDVTDEDDDSLFGGLGLFSEVQQQQQHQHQQQRRKRSDSTSSGRDVRSRAVSAPAAAAATTVSALHSSSGGDANGGGAAAAELDEESAGVCRLAPAGVSLEQGRWLYEVEFTAAADIQVGAYIAYIACYNLAVQLPYVSANCCTAHCAKQHL